MEISQALIGARRRRHRALYLLVPAVGTVVAISAQAAGLSSSLTGALVSACAVVLMAWLVVLAKLVLEVGVATRYLDGRIRSAEVGLASSLDVLRDKLVDLTARVTDITSAHASASAQLRSLANSADNDAKDIKGQIGLLDSELGRLNGRLDELEALGKSHDTSVVRVDDRLRALEDASLPELVDELAVVVDELSTAVVGAAAS